MFQKATIIVSFVLALLVSQHDLWAQTGEITGVGGQVNGSTGTAFQPGDYIRGSAGANGSVAVGGQDPTGFTLSVAILAPAGSAVLADSADYVLVSAGQTRSLYDFVGYTVPAEDYFPNYDFVATLTYFNLSTLMNVQLDSDALFFTTD